MLLDICNGKPLNVVFIIFGVLAIHFKLSLISPVVCPVPEHNREGNDNNLFFNSSEQVGDTFRNDSLGRILLKWRQSEPNLILYVVA